MQMGEDQQPRRTLVIVSCLLLLAVGSHSPSTAQTARRGTVRDTAALREAMLTVHNAERAARGVPPLAWSEDLAAEASLSAIQLAARWSGMRSAMCWCAAMIRRGTLRGAIR